MFYRQSKSEVVYQVVIHCIVGLIALSAIFPLLYVIGMSFTSLHEMLEKNYFVIIPSEPTLEAYKRLATADYVWRGMGISFFRSVVGTALMLVITLLGAFVLSRKTLPGRKMLLVFILITILFNGGMIPTYLVVKKLGMMDSVWSLIIPVLIDSFSLLVIKIFIEGLPGELIESAKIDGCGETNLLLWIIMPLTIPSLVAIGLFNVVMHWNSWFDAMLYIQDKVRYPFQLILRNILTMQSAQDSSTIVLGDSQRVSLETMKMSGVVFGIIPIMCIYPFFQKHFTKGMFIGAVKG